MNGLRTALNKWSRKTHRWMTVAASVPLLLVIATGLLLQLKKDVAWIQPPTARGESRTPSLPFDRILDAARAVPQAGVRTWADIDRLDVRPSRGVIKIRTESRWEVQIDASTGDLLHVAYRRSDLIEQLHDGSFFGNAVKLWVFLPAGALLLGLWITGLYLWFAPHLARRARARRAVP